MNPPLSDPIVALLVEIKSTQAAHTTLLESLAGNGQPGRVGILEEEMKALQRKNARIYGYGGGFAGGITLLLAAWEYLVHFLKGSH